MGVGLSSPGGFGQPAAMGGSAFGQPSGFGQSPSTVAKTSPSGAEFFSEHDEKLAQYLKHITRRRGNNACLPYH